MRIPLVAFLNRGSDARALAVYRLTGDDRHAGVNGACTDRHVALEDARVVTRFRGHGGGRCWALPMIARTAHAEG
jgi:hypothetical protein